MRYRMLAVLSAFVVVGGFFVVTAQQAGAQIELNFVAHQTNAVFVPAGGQATLNPTSAPAIGDEEIIRDTLTEGTTTIGYTNIVCTDTFNDNGLCDAVFAITGQGDIHGTALIRGLFDPNLNQGAGPQVFDGDIDGGTFAYADVTGYAHGVNLPDGDDQYSFFLN